MNIILDYADSMPVTRGEFTKYIDLFKKVIEKISKVYGESCSELIVPSAKTAQILKEYGYPSGAVVSSVAQGSPAEENGIRRGDIITEFNGSVVDDYNKFNSLFEEVTPNQQVAIKIYRNGNYYSANLKIGSNNSVK